MMGDDVNQNRRWLLVVFVLALNLLASLWLNHAPAPAIETKTLVYRVVEVPGPSPLMQATLNEYGQAGWELAAVAMGDIQAPRLILKKQE
jgi:hypothetical protein